MVSSVWNSVFAVLGAVAVGATALIRLSGKILSNVRDLPASFLSARSMSSRTPGGNAFMSSF